MKKNLLSVLLALSPLLLLAQLNKKALIIGIDGCRPDALEEAETPNLDNLIANGLYSPDALNDDITISGPGWSAILCGVWADKHQVTGNNFDGHNYEAYPSLFKHINENNTELHTISICHWAPINDFIIQDEADFKLNVSSDEEVASQAAAYIAQNDPDLVFLHFDDVDHAGHGQGFSPDVPEYIAAIEGVDAYIGTVLNTIEQRPNYAQEDWMIFVTTDHGGLGTSHGGNSMEEERVFVIASGDELTPSVITKDSMVLSAEVQNCLGDSLELSFDGNDDYLQITNAAGFNFGTEQDFTIECRVRTPTSADVAIVGTKDWDSGSNKGFIFSFRYPSGPEWKVNIGDGTSRADINTGGAIADDEWHTLSVSFDRDGWMKMYEDGQLLDSTDISYIGDINIDEGLFIGADIDEDYAFAGAIAELRVWNTLVDAQTIDQWHCASLENTHPNYSHLLGYWKLNEGLGTQALDYSGNEHHAAINGAQWNVLDSIVVYDYSATPRLVDIVPSVFEHLCIDINETWALDGSSLIPECVLSNTDHITTTTQLDAHFFPIPASKELHLSLETIVNNEPIRLQIYNVNGEKVYEQTVKTQEHLIDVSAFAAGSYNAILVVEEKNALEKKIVIVPRD